MGGLAQDVIHVTLDGSRRGTFASRLLFPDLPSVFYIVDMSHGHGFEGPYLPHPYPLLRTGQAADNYPRGFISLHEDCRPKAHPDRPCCPERVFHSYGEWWQAHHPPPGPPPPE